MIHRGSRGWLPGLLLLLALVVAACGPTERPVQGGALLETFPFEAAGTFEEGDYQGATLRIASGTYLIETENQGIIWGQGGTVHTDVAVEAQGQASSTDAHYGVMCRADPANTGDGYLFAISSGGAYIIAKGEGDSFLFLADGNTNAVHSGSNTVRGVCVGSYLALYVNGTFVASAQDSTYSSGLPALAGNAGSSGPATLTFDNLAVYSAGFAE